VERLQKERDARIGDLHRRSAVNCEIATPRAWCLVEDRSSRQFAAGDDQIRSRLKGYLRTLYSNDPGTVILDELGLRHGYSRIDVVVVNGSLHGFEIKSDRDTFRRLARQAETYNRVLDFVTLVTGQRHADHALGTVPEWWGIQLAQGELHEGIHLVEVRKPSQNPAPDKLAIAKLLWREEALAFLEELGAADGFRYKPRRLVYSRLAEIVELDALRAHVRCRLRSRRGWRSGERQTSCGD
jgi:hypothetical protein